jgi:alkyldihydroxyacetonephosphate synthase
MQVAVKAKVDEAAVCCPNANCLPYNVGNAVSFRAKPLFSSHLAGSTGDTEALGAWGYQDSYFVLNVKSDGSKYAMMKGARYSISGKPLTGLVNFVEEELDVVIDPNGHTFPACDELRNIPESNLGSEGEAELAALLGDEDSRISVEPVERARHGTGHTQEDMYDLRTGLIRFRLPDAVVWPRDEGEIEALVSLAIHKTWCLIPFGGGTNVTHSTHCPKKAIDPRPMISVDMKLMNRVLWVNEEDGLAHVEAGITGAELIQSMEKLGFTIGHEPDSYEFSTLGGWIATKASGMKQNKYGNIEDIVKEVNVVGAKGLMSHKHKMEKTSVGRSSIGIDLKSLMLGSEGCFGVITSAVIKIWPLAESRSYESVLLPNFDAGLRYVKDLSKMRAMKPASVRLLDNDQFRLGQALKESPSGLQLLRNLVSKKVGCYMGNISEKYIVCATITFEGTSDEVKIQKKLVRELASVHGGILAGSQVGKAGYDLTFAIAYLRDFALNFNILGESFETFAPWSKLTQVVEATKKRIHSEHKSRALPGVPFVCCRITQLYDDGVCIYFYFCMQMSGVAEPSDVFSMIERSARQEILDNGGSLSHHHGLGKLRSSFVPQIYSQGYMDSVVAVKEALDPNNTFGARNGIFQ